MTSYPGRLKVAARNRSAMAMPTPLAKPCPRGPVVTSTPGACRRSGWPGVLEPSWRKRLQLVERQIVAGDVQQAVEQGRTVAGGEDEAVAIRPVRILGIEVHELGQEDVGHGGGAERQTGVAGVGGLDRVDGEDAQGVDGFGFELSIERGGSDGGQENLLERRRGS